MTLFVMAFLAIAFADADDAQQCLPNTITEAHRCLDEILSDEAKFQIKSMAYDELALTHFGLGLWIRNTWIHNGAAPLAAAMRQQGFLHADDMSGIIIETYWSQRNGCSMDLDKFIDYYESYWRAQDQWIEEPDPETGIVRMRRPEGGFKGILDQPKPECPFPLDQKPLQRGANEPPQ